MAAEAQRAETLRIEEEQRMAAAERERLDATIASRLSRDGGGAMLDTPTTSMSSGSSVESTKAKSKYDLSTWRYAELRDTINNSTGDSRYQQKEKNCICNQMGLGAEMKLPCAVPFRAFVHRQQLKCVRRPENAAAHHEWMEDSPEGGEQRHQKTTRIAIGYDKQDMELLLACKEEFHRRLRIYNAWKSRNQSERDAAAPRAPNAIYTNAAQIAERATVAPQVNPALIMQRYFKVPFSRPADIYKNNNNNNNDGRDDLQMCEIPLDQTGLTRKKGAEILETEFETVWMHLGGAPMQKWKP
ncbi:unnamed protein product [Nippostrongylus brasiliensis]|uniref:Myosin-VI_CBD domain-containing protein n=1 Tax=Nippostrongylus brasiliensis TaxID=27835 RepID=A0A0N4Y4G3_NIPBR|nr:unnamed protein product [Nippostrongylus brasiliensis]